MFFSKFSSAFVLAAAYFCVTVAAQGSGNCSLVHFVRDGELLGSVAYHLGTTLQDLRECNPDQITENDRPDDSLSSLRILDYTADGREQPNWTCKAAPPYTVRKGDTCESIASGLSIDVESIYFCNDINIGCMNIYPGQNLTIAANWGSNNPDRTIYQ